MRLTNYTPGVHFGRVRLARKRGRAILLSMARLHRGYLIAALILAVIVFAVSLWLFPEWKASLRLIVSLVVAVVVGVVGLIAAARQAFEYPTPPPTPPIAPQIDADNLKAGRDISLHVGDTHIHQAPEFQPPPLTPLHQIPPPPPDFTGREAELNDLLANFEAGAAISGLRGLGGVGKTALALKLAERVQSRYPGAQFLIELKGASDAPLSPADALAHVIRAYHPTAKLPEGEAELRALYLSVLHDQRALLLLDDARDAAQVTPLLPPSGCGVIVTSRQKFTLPGLRAKDLDILPPDDAHTLLLRIADRIGDQAQTIADLCGYLPLALRLAGSALAERVDLSPADYLRRLGDAQQRLRLTGADASLSLSYDLLTPEQQKGWRALAVFPDTFDRAAAAAVCALEPDPAGVATASTTSPASLPMPA